MESTLANLISIARVSQELSAALTNAVARGVIEPDVLRTQSGLNKIIISSQKILEFLNRCRIDLATPDEQLQDQIFANTVICLFALNEMKRTIVTDWQAGERQLGHVLSEMFSPTSPHENVRKATKIFDNHRKYIDRLINMSGILTRQVDAQHQVMDPAISLDPHVDTSTIVAFSGSDTLRKQSQIPGPTTSRIASCVSDQDVFHGRTMYILSDQTESLASEHSNNHSWPESGTEPNIQVNLIDLDTVLRWLDTFRCVERHVEILIQRQIDTCTWLPETSEYKAWLAGENPFLWLQGKAGSGKSVLIASVVEHLENTHVTPGQPLAFFYCDFGKEESTDATQVIRSVMYQLLDQYRHGGIKPGALQVINNLVKESQKGVGTLKNITRLASLVSRIAGQFLRRPFIVIDALDECKDVNLLPLVLLGLKADEVRLLVSSRPIQAIKHRFSGLPSISLDKMTDAVSGDIELHINREIDSHSRLGLFDPVLKQETCSMLCRKADGMFRWVQCQLDALKRCVTLQEFQETLNGLPLGLDATYERILHGIDQRLSEGKVARRTLIWLVTASRPLVLGEIVEALSIDLLKRKLDQSIAPMHKYVLLDVLGSLVVHNEETDIVNLSHFSVKEYLMDELTRIKLPDFHIDLQEAHKQVFQQCMYYLAASLPSLFDNNGGPASQPLEHSTTMFNLIPSRPLLDYVFSCCFDHLTHLEPTDNATLDSMMILQSKIQEHPLVWKHLCGLASLYPPYKSWITPEHDFIICVLISIFPEPFLRAFLNHTPRSTKYSSNPLVHTVQFNKVDHAKTLLLHGVDADSSGCQVITNGVKRDAPLVAALDHGNDVLADLFLTEGSAAIPQQVYSTIFGMAPVRHSSRIVVSLLQADEFVEWAASVQSVEILLRLLDTTRHKSQHQVTENDHIGAMQRLVQIGLDLSSKPFFLMVASAVSNRHFSLLEYLFSIKAPMPSGTLITEEMAPLIRALTHQGVNVDAITANGDAELHMVLAKQCSGDSRCWVLECVRCSVVRTTLLTTLGRKDERTLIKIIRNSKGVAFRFITKCRIKGHNARIRHIASLLKRICFVSGALLRAINQYVLHMTVIDYSAKCWLSGEAPNVCLKALEQMDSLTTDSGLTYKERTDRTAALFDEYQLHFHFLLEADVSDYDLDDLLPDPPKLDGAPCAYGIHMQPQLTSRPWKSSTSRICIVFVGQARVGKSSLINMMMSIPDQSRIAAPVGYGTRAGTLHSASYSCVLTNGLQCELWDTPGLASTATDGSFLARMADQIPGRQKGTIVMWCIQATKIENSFYWQQFRRVYDACCGNSGWAVPAIVITQMASNTTGWKQKCKSQIRQLGQSIGGYDVRSVRLLRVRKHCGPTSPEYIEDSKALRNRISRLVRNPPCRVFPPSLV